MTTPRSVGWLSSSRTWRTLVLPARGWFPCRPNDSRRTWEHPVRLLAYPCHHCLHSKPRAVNQEDGCFQEWLGSFWTKRLHDDGKKRNYFAGLSCTSDNICTEGVSPKGCCLERSRTKKVSMCNNHPFFWTFVSTGACFRKFLMCALCWDAPVSCVLIRALSVFLSRFREQNKTRKKSSSSDSLFTLKICEWKIGKGTKIYNLLRRFATFMAYKESPVSMFSGVGCYACGIKNRHLCTENLIQAAAFVKTDGQVLSHSQSGLHTVFVKI